MILNHPYLKSKSNSWPRLLGRSNFANLSLFYGYETKRGGWRGRVPAGALMLVLLFVESSHSTLVSSYRPHDRCIVFVFLTSWDGETEVWIHMVTLSSSSCFAKKKKTNPESESLQASDRDCVFLGQLHRRTEDLRVLSHFQMGSNSEGVGEGFLLAWSGMYFPNICKLMEEGEGDY